MPISNLPPAVSSKNYAQLQHKEPAVKLERSLTRKLTRKFRKSNFSDTDSSKSSSTSLSTPSPSSPSSPAHSRRSSNDGGPLTHVKSGQSTESTTSNSSAYDYGYGSGCYAVNLEHMYPRSKTLQVPTMTTEPEEREIIVRGLHKFTAQDYMSLL